MTDQKPWYRHLARTNRLIVEARERIENLKARISELEDEERSTGRATARLHRFEVTLQLMSDHRAVILERVRNYRLPSYEARGALISLTAPSIWIGSAVHRDRYQELLRAASKRDIFPTTFKSSRLETAW